MSEDRFPASRKRVPDGQCRRCGSAAAQELAATFFATKSLQEAGEQEDSFMSRLNTKVSPELLFSCATGGQPFDRLLLRRRPWMMFAARTNV